MSDSAHTTGHNVVAIDFHGDQIVTFTRDGEPYVAMRRVVENLGLSWSTQFKKFEDGDARFSCCHMATTGADGKSYQMLAMPVSKLPLWLATINPNKIPDPAKRAKIELYQSESAIALHDYWTKGVAVRGDMDGVVTSFDPSAISVMVGAMKKSLRKALTEMVPAMLSEEIRVMLPSLVEREVLTSRYSVVEGVSALEVAEIAGYAKGRRPRGATQFISRRLGRYHEDRAVPIRRSRHGSGNVRLFDEVTARRWLNDGGKSEIDHYMAGRKGQGNLRLI